MNLPNRILAVTICSVSILPAMAASIDIYGKANVSFQSSDDGEGRFTEIKSNASRIGFKGSHILQDNLSVVYKAEFQVDMDGDSDKGDSITDRNQYVGLKGNFGEVLLGNNDTILKQSQGKTDLFSDLNADIKVLFKGENRMSDTLTYKSPKFSGFQFATTYIAEEDADGEDGYSVGVFYGDKGLKKSKVFASLAIDTDVNGYDITRATVQGKIAGIILAAMFQTQESEAGADMDGYMMSAKYSFDQLVLKGQVQLADHDGGDNKSAATIGVDYRLAKSTKLYAFYTSFDMDSEDDRDYLALGIEYKF